jgi:hypothetical protein
MLWLACTLLNTNVIRVATTLYMALPPLVACAVTGLMLFGVDSIW